MDVNEIQDIPEARKSLAAASDAMAETVLAYRRMASAPADLAPGWKGEDAARFLAKMEEYAAQAEAIHRRAEFLFEGAERILSLYERTSESLAAARGM